MNILVLGGYGNFGGRICRALAGDSRIALQVAGRDLGQAKSLADELGATACRVDSVSPELARQFRSLEVGLVIHTAGPFQAQDYSVAQAAAAAGAHYIDLADGRRFVCDFVSRMDPSFHSAGTCAVTGASTVPALSSYGWGRPQEVQFARLKPRLGALCDIPDLELFPMRYAGARQVMFRAALEVRFTQQLFAALAWLRRREWLKEPARLAGVLHRAGGIFDPLGTPDGGMVVRLAGSGRGGQRLRLAWHITAGRFRAGV